jgi:hypothetical protein
LFLEINYIFFQEVLDNPQMFCFKF